MAKSTAEQELRAAVALMTGLIENRSRIETALARTRGELPAAEAALARAVTELGKAEADMALGAEGSGSTVQFRRAVTSAREAADATTAAIGALESRKQAVEAEIAKVFPAYEAARRTWALAVADEFRAEYLKAAEVFAAVIRKGIVIHEAVGQYAGWLRDMEVPTSPAGEKLQLTEQVFDKQHSTWKNLPATGGDPKLEAIDKSLRALQGPEDIRRLGETIVHQIRQQAAERNVGLRGVERPSPVVQMVQ